MSIEHFTLEDDSSPAVAAGVGSRSVGARRHTRHAGAFSIIDQGLVSATNFTTTLVLARLCSQAELGVYYLAWTVVLFIVALQNNLVSIPYTIYAPRREGRSLHTYSGSSLVHQMATSLMAVLGLLALVAAMSFGAGPASLRPVVFVLLGAVPLMLLREYVRRFAFAHLHVEIALGVDVLVAVVQLGSLALLVRYDALSVPAVYGVMGVACAVAAASWFLLVRRPMRFVPARIVGDWRQNWRFSRWTLACQLTGLCYHALPWLLTFAHSAAATGVLAAANTLVGLSSLFVIGLLNFLTPKATHAFTAEGPRGLTRVLRKAAAVFAVALGTFCLLAVLAGGPMALVVYGPKYGDIGAVIAVLALGTLIDGLGLTAGTGLWAMDRPSANFVSDAIQMAVMLVAAICLVSRWDVLGIAIAIVAGGAVGTLIRWTTLWALLKTTEHEPGPASWKP